ncbi:DUF1254 domain-containing protein [Tomitella biformata]|uniref:DUF1254 domain-containing protein n=1 Tax=Tomitella biformata TaxID=630403 RepID=UPI0004672070|nr:DUF1254 domain-containing protein [Tomitella biformata]
MKPMIDPTLTPDDLARLTTEAFDWGISLVGFYELRHLYAGMEGQPAYRGINRVQPTLDLFDAKVRYATTVNASTLYSGGMFDVSDGPAVLETPAVNDGRYWSVQALDPHVDWFFMAGSQFTGNSAQKYVIVGPRWRGSLPDGFTGTEIVRAPSDTFSLTVRVAVTTRTAEDMAGARAAVCGVRASPLALWLENGGRVPDLEDQPIVKGGYASFARMDAITDIGKSMTGVDYLQLLSLVLVDPTMTLRRDSMKECGTIERLADLGLRDGVDFEPERLTDVQRGAIERGFSQARIASRDAFDKTQIDMNGWRLQSSLFYDDLDYRSKAGANDVAWGTPVPYQSHTIGYLFEDSDGRPFDGADSYTITLDVNNLPPVTEFWEIPVYDVQGYFIDNPENRYSVTSYLSDAGLYHTDEGQLTFYLQAERPKDANLARNWLPVSTDGGFQLAARFYGPLSPLIDGSYPMPPAVRTSQPA